MNFFNVLSKSARKYPSDGNGKKYPSFFEYPPENSTNIRLTENRSNIRLMSQKRRFILLWLLTYSTHAMQSYAYLILPL